MTLAIATLTAVAGSVVVAPPALAGGGEVTFEGGGWGHGIGMSQYGALGQALDGSGYKAILTHYYTGTSVKDLTVTSPGSPLLVYDEAIWVGVVWDATDVVFIPRNGKLRICHAGDGICPMKKKPADGETWKVKVVEPGVCVFKLQSQDGAFEKKGERGDCWASVSLLDGARVEIPGIGQTYGHGTMRIRPVGDRDTATALHISFSMDLEDYVAGIAEMPSSWDQAALKAQAVASRTYGAAKVHQRETGVRTGNGVNPALSSTWKDICWCHVRRSVSDQAYAGWAQTQLANWADAVTATAGKVITYPDPAYTSNGVIDAFYGSSTGGVTETMTGGFGSGDKPYLTSVDDHWAIEPEVGNPYSTWSAIVSGDDLMAVLSATSYGWGVSFDYLIDVSLLSGPPEAMVTVKGSAGGETITVDVPAWWLRDVLDLRSPGIAAVTAVVTGSPHGQVWSQGGAVQSPIEPGDRFGSAISVGDFDGDGHPDVASAAPTDGVNTVIEGGLVNILFGDGFSLTSDGDQMLHQDQPGMRQSAEEYDHFGSAIVSGDFDGDGSSDLAVGVPDENVDGKADAGLIHVFAGGAGGLVHDSSSPINQKTKGIRGTVDAGDRFGAAMAAGDFDSDGYQDLAVASPGRRVDSKKGAGMVTIVPGSPSGLDPEASYNIHQGKPGVANAPEYNDDFGGALAVGDLDGDGHDDLVVGSPGEGINGRPGAGMVHVFFGGSPRLKGHATAEVHQDTSGVSGSSQTGDGFGSALAAGDIDGDGRDELAIGVPGENIGGKPDGGRVVVVFGTASRSLTHTRNVNQDVAGIGGTTDAGDRFGHSVLVVDVVGGPRADLIVGAPQKKRAGKTAAGVVLIVPGKTGSGLNFMADHIYDQADLPAPGIVETGDEFGYALATGDFDGDGHPELLVGSPGETLGTSIDAGVIQIAANFG